MSTSIGSMSIALHQVRCIEEAPTAAFSSLKELCTNSLVSHYSWLLKNAGDLPRELKQALLSAAILRNQVDSVRALMKIWQHDSVKLEMPTGLKTWKLFISRRFANYFRNQVTTLVSCMEIILYYYMRLPYLCSKPGVVHCLDFSELIAPCHLTKLLSCQILDRLKGLSDSQISHPKTYNPVGTECRDSQEFFNECVVKINCSIKTRETAELFRSALTQLKNCGKTQFLSVIGLHVFSEVDGRQTHHLLDLLDPAILEAFSCSTVFGPTLDTEPYPELLEGLKKFTQLKSLALGCHRTSRTFHRGLALPLSELLQELVKLEHLDLCGYNIDGNLDVLLGGMYSKEMPSHSSSSDSYGQLETLLVNNCELSPVDLSYLARSTHASALKNLDLSSNVLDIRILRKLLVACKELCVLDLGSCGFQNGSTDDLFCALSTAKMLRYLDIGLAFLSPGELLSNITNISKMTRLEGLKICFREWLITHNRAIHEENFESEFHNALMSLENRPTKPVEIIWYSASRR